MFTPLTRRELLIGLVPLLTAPALAPRMLAAPDPAGAEAESDLPYRLDITILYGLLSFSIHGRIHETVDRAGGRYRVTITGTGAGVETWTDTAGILRAGRYAPTRSRGRHVIRGRPSWREITYDHARGVIAYHAVEHTFFLGRRRQVDDLVRAPAGEPVDDAVSACLNFAAGSFPTAPDGSYRTWVVRRARAEDEGPDDVKPDGYRVEIVPLTFRAEREPATGRLTARIDFTRWSAWARSGQPAVITFRPDRRLESLQSPLILGSQAVFRLA